ncbi:uncharacterized protein LOC114515867 [Dendronephthya gigantea]|uniref:uncharacterized protein LOC114515867 n=1 Tax=Dendronephthya gigantea TaxID=151771 RepID=UPI00106A266E|nr:uncharacterized protein LOC114515867 [Dendronephthya gigantea]
MEKRLVVSFLNLLIFAVVQICESTGQVSHCIYGVTVKDLLKLARVNEASAQSYAAKLKQHKIDQTVLGSLTLQQLEDIGITALGDRLKIFNFFSKDPDDCGSTRCQNKGICQDGYRCFSCVCDPKSGFYGPRCEFKCPCLNRGVCKTTQTGFECVCPPGYSGDLCKTKYLTEKRFVKLEETIQQLTTRLQQSEQQIKNLQSRSWQLYRANEILNQLEKLQLSGQTPTYTQKLPILLPKNTKAILISIFCKFGNGNGHAYLNYVTYQKDNDNAAAKAEGYNTHYNVYANTFLYEQMIPWNTTLPNELIFRVTYSTLTGGNYNWYRVRLVGYVISP